MTTEILTSLQERLEELEAELTALRLQAEPLIEERGKLQGAILALDPQFGPLYSARITPSHVPTPGKRGPSASRLLLDTVEIGGQVTSRDFRAFLAEARPELGSTAAAQALGYAVSAGKFKRVSTGVYERIA